MDIVVFGIGEIGKKLLCEIQEYSEHIRVIAIADNNAISDFYHGIRIIKPSEIVDYNYDEIWITTVYFKEIIKQLTEYGINRANVYYIEPVVPILDERLRKVVASGNESDLFPGGKVDERVISYLKDHKLRMYCYSFFDEYIYKDSLIQYDDTAKLFYGIYEGKRMYMARRYNTSEKARAYYNSVTMEQDERSPHCYKEIKCGINGNVVDVGAAEGIFGLDVIDYVSHLTMVEADEEWVEALEYTYREYRDKVSIVPMYADDHDGEGRQTLDSICMARKTDYIKMDIEGMEMNALKGAEMLIKRDHPSFAICVYHHKMDNDRIGQWFNSIGYNTNNSQGFVVCVGDWELKINEVGFRKALIFAKYS